MTRVSIFGTTRPDIGAIVHFNTSGENETALDEDIFEKKVIEHFEKIPAFHTRGCLILRQL